MLAKCQIPCLDKDYTLRDKILNTELLKSLMACYTNHYAIKDWTEDYRADISIEGCCRAGEITGRCTTGRVLTKKKNLT